MDNYFGIVIYHKGSEWAFDTRAYYTINLPGFDKKIKYYNRNTAIYAAKNYMAVFKN